MLSLQIKSKPGDVPAVIEIDISALEVGDSIRVSDLPLPEGVTTDVEPDAPVVVAHAARAVEAEVEETEGAEAAAGGEPPAASDEG